MATFVMIEVNFYELYKKQPLFKDIHKIMNEIGFIYQGNIEQYSSKIDGRFLFSDAIFENINLAIS
jgi:hypothetical protein